MSDIPDLKIECQPTQISQVIINLLNNAFDAVSMLPEKWVHVDVIPHGNERLKIIVTDSGQGIPDAISEKMMEPFFTTKPVGKGTGLGLSISQGIAQDLIGIFKFGSKLKEYSIRSRSPRSSSREVKSQFGCGSISELAEGKSLARVFDQFPV